MFQGLITAAMRLQWSRGRMTAERRPGAADSETSALASMEPRSDDRGERRTAKRSARD